jgi:ankyrin repeat protein
MNIEGMTALLFAVGNGHLLMVSAIVACLPKDGVIAALVETNMHGSNALLHAADCNHV